MADLKISQLTGATTPLAGTEVLPIVQSSSTKKIATDDLTVKNIRSNATTGILQVAGPAAAATRTMTVPDANFTAARTDAANSFTGDQTLSTGNLVIGTSGKGIDFAADPSAPGVTSELLDDYEEGLWTVALTADTSGTITLVPTSNTGSYTKIGNMVFCQALVQVDSVSSPVGLLGISLPFTGGAGTEGSGYAHGTIAYFNVDLPLLTVDVSAEIVPGSSVIYLKCSVDNGAWTRLEGSAVASGSFLTFSIAYSV